MHLRLLASCFASCGASCIAAEGNPVSKADERAESLPAVFAPRPAPTSARPSGAAPPASSMASPRRAISPEMAAHLSAVAARAAPTAGMTSTAGAANTSPGESGDVVRLKPYVVQEGRLPRFKEHELLTPKGKLELARKRYPGFGPYGDAAAMQRLEDDFRLERLRELADQATLFEVDGGKPPIDAKRLINDGKHAEPFHQQFGHQGR